ncbi:hypothetical protein ACI65C_007421 [Semiaphis heraclei]
MAAVAGLYGFGDDSRTVAARFVERQRLANRDSPTDTYVHHRIKHMTTTTPLCFDLSLWVIWGIISDII